jgi:putative redox protein
MSDESAAIRVVTRAESPAWQATASAGAHTQAFDEPVSGGGGDTGPTPTQTVLSALGACTAMTLRMYAERKQWPLRAVSVDLAYRQRDKEGTVIERQVTLEGDLDDAQRERLLQVANACPVHRLLTGKVEVPTTLA